MYIIDKSSSIIRKISNDAYNFIMYDEDLLDENNMQDINELNLMFPSGFEIEFIRDVENSDLVEVVVTPYIGDNFAYDRVIELFDGIVIQIQVCNHECAIRFFDTKQSKELWREFCEIQYNENGKPYFITKAGSMYHIWKSIPA